MSKHYTRMAAISEAYENRYGVKFDADTISFTGVTDDIHPGQVIEDLAGFGLGDNRYLHRLKDFLNHLDIDMLPESWTEVTE